MSVRKGLTKTDYARHDEEAELENINDFLWESVKTIDIPEEYTAQDAYMYSAKGDREHSEIKKARENQNRSYTSACRTKQASYSGRNCSQRNTRKSCTNYRGRR